MNSRRNGSRRAAGFTLMELVIAVTIISILAALAIPSYRAQVMRSNRSDAMAALLRVAAAQEKFYLQNNTYTAELGDAGLKLGDRSANNHYEIEVTSADADSFVATAIPLEGQEADARCLFFSIDNLGTKDATNDNCWR